MKIKKYHFKLYQPYVGEILHDQVEQEATEKRWSRSEVIRAAIDNAIKNPEALTGYIREARFSKLLNVAAVTQEQYNWVKSQKGSQGNTIRSALWAYFQGETK